MFERTYKIADCVVRIRSIYEEVHGLCDEYRSEETAELEITITPENIAYERRKSAEEDKLEGLPVKEYPDSYLETLAVYRQLADALVYRDIMLFHGSVVAVDGVAYLFTAQSGTGKSTHTRLWRQLFGERAVMINDDKPLLRITDEGVVAYGTPWNGKHRLGSNTKAPLKAICILERSKENHIEQVSPAQALAMLMQQSHRPADAAGKLAFLELLDRMIPHLKFYRLGCNMDPEAAQVAYNGMQD